MFWLIFYLYYIMFLFSFCTWLYYYLLLLYYLYLKLRNSMYVQRVCVMIKYKLFNIRIWTRNCSMIKKLIIIILLIVTKKCLFFYKIQITCIDAPNSILIVYSNFQGTYTLFSLCMFENAVQTFWKEDIQKCQNCIWNHFSKLDSWLGNVSYVR